MKTSEEKIIDHLMDDKIINSQIAYAEYGINGKEFDEIMADLINRMVIHQRYNRDGTVDYWA